MEYGKFIQLLDGNGLREKETPAQLENIISKFPYFSAARMLYAKSLREQNSIHYNEALKLASAYSVDRTVLRQLINKQNISEPAFAKAMAGEEKKIEPEVEVVQSPKEEIIFTPTAIEKEETKIVAQEIPEVKVELKTTSVNPQEILEKRISELNASPQPSVKERESEQFIAENISDKEHIISREAEKAVDVLDKMQIEYAMEESILESLEKLPVLESTTPKKEIPLPPPVKIVAEEKTDKESPRSFTSWLKAVSVKPFDNFEQVHLSSSFDGYQDSGANDDMEEVDEETEVSSSLSKEELIEKFIAEEPKIVPSKAEFYSPANQAKKSLMEHDDVVSETLARIFLQQGNFEKARWSYERLSLLHPEKKSFFAARLEEIAEREKDKRHEM